MAPTFSDLPAELVVQIVYEAVRVRTAQRAVRLRLVSRAFSEYTTEAILRTDILSRALSADRAIVAPGYERPGGQAWAPLLESYVTQSIVRQKQTAPNSRHAYLRRLATHLCELRGLDTTDRDVMSACVRELVKWNLSGLVPTVVRDLLLGTPQEYSGEVSFAIDTLIGAVLFGEADLVRRLLVDPGLPNDTMEKLHATVTCVAAAIHQNDIATLQLIPLEPLCTGLRNWTTSCGALLLDASRTGSASMFEAVLNILDDKSRPLDRAAAADIERAAMRSPSLPCHRKVMRLLRELAARPPEVFLFTLRYDYHGATRLVNAATSGRLDLVEFYANGGAREVNPEGLVWFLTDEVPPGSDRFLGEPLFEAVSQGHVPVVRFLLNKGANPNWLVKKKGYALHQAVRGGSLTMARLLVDHGADVNLGVPPPLSLAVFHEDMAMFRYLMDQGADLEGESHASAWALSFARSLGLDSMAAEIVRLGIREDAQMAWVPSSEEAARHPIHVYHYNQSYRDPEGLDWHRLTTHEGVVQARCLPIGQIPPLPAMPWERSSLESESESESESDPDTVE